jgi:hypothetical protein
MKTIKQNSVLNKLIVSWKTSETKPQIANNKMGLKIALKHAHIKGKLNNLVG